MANRSGVGDGDDRPVRDRDPADRTRRLGSDAMRSRRGRTSSVQPSGLQCLHDSVCSAARRTSGWGSSRHRNSAAVDVGVSVRSSSRRAQLRRTRQSASRGPARARVRSRVAVGRADNERSTGPGSFRCEGARGVERRKGHGLDGVHRSYPETSRCGAADMGGGRPHPARRRSTSTRAGRSSMGAKNLASAASTTAIARRARAAPSGVTFTRLARASSASAVRTTS